MTGKQPKQRRMNDVLNSLPSSPGVYWFLNKKNEVIYIGKAINLKRRVASYFNPHNTYINTTKPRLLKSISNILFEETKSDFDAIILESQKIRLFKPKYNQRQKNGTKYLFIEFSSDQFPRVMFKNREYRVKQTEHLSKSIIGPFTQSRAIFEAMRILRPILPYRTCSNSYTKPCWHSRMGLCPAHSSHDYLSKSEQIKRYNLTLQTMREFFSQTSSQLISSLQMKTKQLASQRRYEEAAKIRDQIRSIQYLNTRTFSTHSPEIQLHGKTSIYAKGADLLKLLSNLPKKITRIEGYDISNFQGTSPTGSMVVFSHNGPLKSQYRTFHINTIHTPNDVGMMKEILSRRLSPRHIDTKNNQYWRLPDIMIIDGGIAQYSIAHRVLSTHLTYAGANMFTYTHKNHLTRYLALYSLAKRQEMVYTDKTQLPVPLSSYPQEVQQLFKAIRDESHRFALKSHRSLRRVRSSKLRSQ